MSDVCAVVLAAGEGTRLRPLTADLPKALCPVGNVPLLDRALARVTALGLDAAVNACYLGSQVVAHVGTRAFVGVEPGDPWGTSGGLARLRDWIDGRGVLVGNADAYLSSATRAPGPDIAGMVDGWDGGTVRILGVPAGDRPAEFGPYRFAGFSLLPWTVVRDLPVERGDLVRTAWRPAERAGRLEVVPFDGTYLDTGTPETYLAANLHAAAPGSLVDPTAVVTAPVTNAVIGAGAVVAGPVRSAVVWPGAAVAAGEVLDNAIRAGGGLTVAVR
ncbi:nucleotidyltransferase family protein [Virgisporangium aurantiacum]|uniref:Nucleotidyl transferase domain-containing protein n=1 Tax=Virgisporangium aurantiacum TaxID=175570 RepID=A0A8J3ZHJ4_9ACTN|nr:sugar phosphate nucleotidyltransferase [Virgisporangium aurantiacum]GIJ61523.1 hypothetical protein Vau01_090390 [Virgisporangium aurantiacum]